MHPIVAVFLAASPAPTATAATATTAEEFYASLQAPVSIEELAVDVATDDLEIRFSLRELGQVSVVVHAEDDGDGRGLVTVGGNGRGRVRRR